MEAESPYDIWNALLDDARWSPSPHNIQPWRVAVVSETEAVLLYDPTRLIPDTDTTGQFTTIGFGIFLEYLRIAASHRNRVLEWQPLLEGLDPEVTRPTPFFRLTLHVGATPDPFPVDLLHTRRTSRLPYAGERPVPVDCLRELEATAHAFGHTFHASQEPDVVRWTLLLNRDTLLADMDDDVARTEVGRWIRFSQREALARKDGLAARCMQMPGWLMRLFFRHHALLDLPIIHQIVHWYYVYAMRGTTTVAWIDGPVANQVEWIEAGRMLGRLWLIAARDGVYWHPFGSIITNASAYARLKAKVGDAEGSPPIWMIARLGFSDEPPPSQRLDVGEIAYREAL